MEGIALEYVPEISISQNDIVAIVNSKGNGLIIKNINTEEAFFLYDEYIINPKIIWSRDGTILSTIIENIKEKQRFIVVIDTHGTELFRQNIGGNPVDFGWTLQGLYLNSSNNTIFYYQDENISSDKKIRSKQDDTYAFSYDGENDKIEITKNKELVRVITGYIYDISLSPSQKYLAYGFGGGFSIYNFQDDNIKFIPSGTDFVFSPNENKVAFQKTKDNGHYTTSSDIYIYDLIENKEIQVTDTQDELESSPHWRDNKTLYFSFINSDEIKIITLEENTHE